MSNLYQVLNENDLIDILNKNQNKLIIMLFSAKWCQPCKMIKPVFIKLSKKHVKSLFLYIDINNYNECKTTNKPISFLDKVEGLPTFLYYINITQ